MMVSAMVAMALFSGPLVDGGAGVGFTRSVEEEKIRPDLELDFGAGWLWRPGRLWIDLRAHVAYGGWVEDRRRITVPPGVPDRFGHPLARSHHLRFGPRLRLGPFFEGPQLLLFIDTGADYGLRLTKNGCFGNSFCRTPFADQGVGLHLGGGLARRVGAHALMGIDLAWRRLWMIESHPDLRDRPSVVVVSLFATWMG
jgi:hypothetical protein